MIHKETIKVKCDELLMALLGKNELCEMWWKTQNRAFDHKTPQELWDADGASDVYNYLMHHAFAGGGS